MVLMCGYFVYRCRRVLSISLRSEIGVLEHWAGWIYPC